MSHHSNDNAHIKQILMDVISLSMSHIHSLSAELKKLDINDANFAEKSPDERRRSMILNNMLTTINDSIHPAHDLALEFFPQAKEFIEACKKNQEMAIQSKLLPNKCICYTCKIKNPVT